MSGSNVQYQGNHPLKTKKVYYNGSTPLTKNQMLTYVEDASLLATLQAAETAAPGSQNFGLARGTLVETPVTASLALFAGVLQDGDEGKANGAWVTIIQPVSGDVLSVRATGATDIAVGDDLELVNAGDALVHEAFDAATTLFRAMEAYTAAADTSILAMRY